MNKFQIIMKKFINLAVYTILLVAVLGFTSCQAEDPIEVVVNEEQALTIDSSLAQLMERMVSNDGSHDNIVDGSSCFDIRFPYQVAVGEIKITVSSAADLEIIEAAIDAIESEDVVLDIIFPITITMADYTEVTVNGIEDLMEIASLCIEGGSDADIECIDIIYPVTFFTYDPNLQLTDTVVVNTDKEMRRFFAGLVGGSDLMSIEFPVMFEKYDGTKISVNTNSELANAIELAKEACDEDDDNDHSDDDFTLEGLNQLLVKCPLEMQWILSGSLLQEDYRAYYLVITDDGVVNAIDNEGRAITGEWSTHWIENRVLLRFNFEDIPALNYDWYLNEINEEKIQLFTPEGDVKINLQVDCDYEVEESNLVGTDSLKAILSECRWLISYFDTGAVEDRLARGLNFQFNADNLITISEGIYNTQGRWEIGENSKGQTVLVLSAIDESLNREWILVQTGESYLQFGQDETVYDLVFEKNCPDDEVAEDIYEINKTIADGPWAVSRYTNNGVDQTEEFTGLEYDFNSESFVEIQYTNNTVITSGIWKVIRSFDDSLKLVLRVSENSDEYPFLSNVWQLSEVTENQIILKYESKDSNIVEVVFEKL